MSIEQDNLLLPQELFAEMLLSEWFLDYGVLEKNKIAELLRKSNLRLKKGKDITDIRLALGKGLKNARWNTPLAREQVAEEIDKICCIARWDFAIARYKNR